jgi:hypothetical protein
MAGTTNRVSLEDAIDVLDRGRACVSWVVDGAPFVEPASVVDEHGKILVEVEGIAPDDGVDEVVLVADEGVEFFELRAMYIRGRPVWRAEPSADGRTWFEIEPTMLRCWDYGTLRFDDAAE